MYEHDFAGNVSGFCDIVSAAAADINHWHVLHRSERWRPRDGNTAYAELDFGNVCELRVKSGSGGADGHLGSAFGPGKGDGEILGVNIVSAGRTEHLHGPLDGTLHGRRAGHAATHFIGQAAQVVFES